MLNMEPLLEVYKKLIEKRLEELVQEKPKSPHQCLFQAVRYSLLAGGKRLRPLLALAVVATYEKEIEKALSPACTLELIHTYSLIHDDLPCMDNDDFRRGKPSLHKVYNPGQALLAGDFLLTYAFEVLAKSPFLSSKQKLSLIYSLAKSAGAEGMIGGQVVDLASEGKMIDWDTLEFMHLGKTSALMTASLEFGGIMANAPPKDLELLSTLGKHLGLGFQIVDDILDATSSLEKMGKPVGGDKKKGKATALSFLSEEKAKQKVDTLFSSAQNILESLSKPAPLLSYLSKKLLYRT